MGLLLFFIKACTNLVLFFWHPLKHSTFFILYQFGETSVKSSGIMDSIGMDHDAQSSPKHDLCNHGRAFRASCQS